MTARKRKIHVLHTEVQLEMDLCLMEDPPNGKVISFPFVHRKAVAESGPETEELLWSDDDIYQLRKAMLHESLHLLAHSRLSPERREELNEWLESNAVEPFSFVVCATECGYHAENLRERLHRVLAQVMS